MAGPWLRITGTTHLRAPSPWAQGQCVWGDGTAGPRMGLMPRGYLS